MGKHKEFRIPGERRASGAGVPRDGWKMLRGAERADLRRALVRQYRLGRPIRSLAKELGRSPCFVRDLLIEAGEPRRGAANLALSDAEAAEMARLYLDDELGIRGLARVGGVSYNTARRALLRAGVTPRQGGWGTTRALRALRAERSS